MQRDHRQERSVQGGRRRFLQGLALVGGAGGLTAVTGAPLAGPARPEEGDAAPAQSGYHETEHIRTYYRKARI
jgi:nitrous oxide reductase